jgi:hypothetical protein
MNTTKPQQYETLLPGRAIRVAAGRAFLHKQGIQYAASVKYLDVAISRAWRYAESQTYPCA